jgi:hypothetical protein
VTAALVFSDAPLCPMAATLRIPCPGCGLTRATLALLHGDLRRAFALHPLALVLVPGVGLFFAVNVWGYVKDGSWGKADAQMSPWVTVSALVVFVAMMGVWIARFFGAFGGPVPV